MKKENVKIGMKVVPFQKTVGEKGLENSYGWQMAKRNNQHFLYIIADRGGYFSLSKDKDTDTGDWFNAEDFNLYYETKYQIGDGVKIRKDLVTNYEYTMENSKGSNRIAYDMGQYFGKEAQITNILGGEYKLNIDNSQWSWTDEMFEDVEERKNDMKYKVGDRVIVTYHGIFNIKNEKGIIKKVDKENKNYVVHFDNNIEGWEDKELNIPDGYGLYVKNKDIVGLDNVSWIERFKKGDFVINCQTENEANELMEILHKEGVKWCSGDSLLKILNYSAYKNNTCYDCDCGTRLSFAELDFYKDRGYKVVKFSDLCKSQSTTEIIKVIRNDKKTTVILENGSKGISKCNSTDEYSERDGFTLAYARALDGNDVKWSDVFGKALNEYSNEELLEEINRRMA